MAAVLSHSPAAHSSHMSHDSPFSSYTTADLFVRASTAQLGKLLCPALLSLKIIIIITVLLCALFLPSGTVQRRHVASSRLARAECSEHFLGTTLLLRGGAELATSCHFSRMERKRREHIIFGIDYGTTPLLPREFVQTVVVAITY